MKTLKDKIAELPIRDQIRIHDRAARLIEMELRQRNLKFKGFFIDCWLHFIFMCYASKII